MPIRIDHQISPKTLLPKIQRLFELSAQKILSLERTWRGDKGAAKYAEGIMVKGEDWVHRGCATETIVREFLSAENYAGLFRSANPATAPGV